MKKILAFALTLIMALSLAACGEKTPAPSGGDTSGGTSQQGQQPDSTPDESTPPDSSSDKQIAWPEDAPIPRPESGTIVQVSNYSGKFREALFFDMDVDDVKKYVEDLIAAGYEFRSGYETINDTFYSDLEAGTLALAVFINPNTDGKALNLSYTPGEGATLLDLRYNLRVYFDQ